MEIEAYNFSRLYKELSKEIWKNGKYVNDTLELTNVHIKFVSPNFNDCILDLNGKKTSIKYLLAELIWYWSGHNNVDFISYYASKWNKISDDGKTSNSAYGYIMFKKFNFNQFELCLDILRKDVNSRRACIILNDANEDAGITLDEQCTIFLQFLIRNGKLDMYTYMRSNDIMYGVPYDMPFFISIQLAMADELNIPVGNYYHNATSLHCYIKDMKKLMLLKEETLYTEMPKVHIDIKMLMQNAQRLYEIVSKDKDNILNIMREKGILYDIPKD